MRGRAAFVTGTDTGVGKTWVSAHLAAAWTRAGRKVAALKAAESGCRVTRDGLVGEDDELLFRAAGGWQPERCRYLFKPAVAPGVAADDLGTSIDFELITRQVDLLRSLAEVVLVEGAGGWLAPMGEGRTVEDLVQCLAIPVIVVAHARLGSINHAALTVRAVRSANLEVLAVLLSVQPGDDAPLAVRNQAEIERIAAVPVLPIDADLVPSVADRLARIGL
jgi:dethiobiotin synthetase